MDSTDYRAICRRGWGIPPIAGGFLNIDALIWSGTWRENGFANNCDTKARIVHCGISDEPMNVPPIGGSMPCSSVTT